METANNGGEEQGEIAVFAQAEAPAEAAAVAEGASGAAPAEPAVPEAGAAPASETLPVFDIYLASSSPRRRQLLEKAGVTFEVRASEVDESLSPDQLTDPSQACRTLAERKAKAAVQDILSDPTYTGAFIVLGSDTMVVCNGEIFGKPKDEADAFRMLNTLAGRSHEVMTSVSLWMVMAPAGEELSLGFRSFVDTSIVTFKDLTSQDIYDYLAVGESFDKAGAYAIQGAGARLVQHVHGSMDTVIGLPVERLLREYGDLLLPASR